MARGIVGRRFGCREPYDLWASQGYLQTTPQHLKPWLLDAGFSEQVVADKFVPFGQGYQSMSPALRDLESIILEKKLRHGDHPLLKMCASNCVVERDTAGNRKLSKKRSTGRIDGMIALTMALGVAPLRTAAKFDVEALIA